MNAVERFSIWRQRTALVDLEADGARFLATAEGAAFLEQLDVHIAPTLVSRARYKMGYAMERSDVVNMIVERLLSTQQQLKDKAPIRYAASADDPWGYLWTCGLRWASTEWGTRAEALEDETFQLSYRSDEDPVLTPLDEVVRKTFDELAPRIAERHQSAVLDLLGWLAANPPQRLSYEGQERIAAHRACPSLTIEQVTAVMNIAWGGRPRQAETSLMGQLLLDPDFRPSDSWTHVRALHYFKKAFRTGENGSRMLTDWAS